MDDIIAGGNQRRLQRRDPGDRGWTKARRTAFIDMLAATCNVTRAAAHVGIPKASAYRLRRRDPQFAALWQTAIQMGYELLEEQLLAYAGVGATVNDIEPSPDAAPEQPFDPKLALELLRHHRTMVDGNRKSPKGTVARATREEAEAALLKKLDALEKRLAHERSLP